MRREWKIRPFVDAAAAVAMQKRIISTITQDKSLLAATN